MTTTVERRAARVLLVDGEGRVLLFLGHDPARPAEGTWWFTVGGGLDDGESHRDAAVRELFEETGLSVPPTSLGGPVHSERAEFWLGGAHYIQDNEFFTVHVDDHDVVTVGFTDLEATFVLDHRWWSVDELRATSDRVYPECLPDLLAALAA